MAQLGIATRRQVKIVIVEDEGLYRDLLRVSLSQNPNLEVIGAYGSSDEALQAVPHLAPQVAILDIDLSGSSMNGIQLGLNLRKQMRDLGIVLLSNHADLQFLASVPQTAIAGWSYLLKRSVSDLDALTRAISGAADGLVVLDPQLVTAMRPRSAGVLGSLTPRQREILGLIAQGYSNAGIADKLVLTERTVEKHINLLYQQLEIDREDSAVQPRVSAVLLYLREGQEQGLGGFPPP
jgi:DNA-binding NarL/FixJ family response regulator